MTTETSWQIPHKGNTFHIPQHTLAVAFNGSEAGETKGNVISPRGLPWQIPGKVATQVVAHQHTLAVQGMLSEVQGQCHQDTHYPKSCNQ